MLFISRKILDCLSRGNKLLICGNGGSASMSSHFAAEFVNKYKRIRPAMSAISLASDVATITAIANDFGFENIFSRQIEAIGNAGDLLIVLSTTGKSANCIKALKIARQMGLETLEFPKPGKDTGDRQNRQLKLIHTVCREIENL